ncbi:MAG: aminopeptidase P family protein [Actinobacteria bacterium]|nr:aminopeptidase P family protein [Actinomycetota bacterium]
MSGAPGPRLKRLRELIAERELDALLVGNLVNVRYLSGFSGTNGVLLVDLDNAVLLTDFRYTEQAAEQAPECEVLDGKNSPREALAERMPTSGRIGFDDADMRVQAHAAWLEALPDGAEMVASAGLVECLREVKDADEIAAIERAAAITDEIYATLANEGLIGRRECDLAWRIEVLAREFGAEKLSFPPIVAAGSHGALPHAEPRTRAVESGELVVLDLGVIADGYCSDATRTFAAGEPAARAREVYELVLRAQETALAAVRPEQSCSAGDAAAREVIETAGHGERFGHSTGHGVGLEVHELPTLSSRSEARLRAGNVVTVEPGIYLPGELGVRIEDLVVVEQGGGRILSNFTKDLTTVD